MFVGILSIVLLFSSACSAKPNILYILADDLGWGDLKFVNNGTKISTPALDSLAENGTVLTNHYVMPVCTPTRSALLTGKYPIHTGTQTYVILPNQAWGLPTHHKLLPEYLKEAGYNTHGIGKWHLGSHTKAFLPTRRGFDTWYGGYGGAQDYFKHTCNKKLDFRFDEKLSDGSQHSTILYNETGNYNTDLFTKRAQDVIQGEEEPFFIYLAYTAPHWPLTSVPTYAKEWYKGVINNGWERKYATAVTIMDQGIGRIVQTLKDTGKYDDTIIIFASDNGADEGCILGNLVLGTNEPLRGAKKSIYEGAVKSPTLIHAPSLLHEKGIKRDALVHITDWMPMLLNIVNGAPRTDLQDLDGVDQFNALKDGIEHSKRQDMLLNIKPYKYHEQCGIHAPYEAIRSGKWKLIVGEMRGKGNWYFRNGRNPEWSYDKEELFDIEADPEERVNLYQDYPDIVVGLKSKIEQYRQTMVEPVITTWPDKNMWDQTVDYWEPLN